MRMRVRGMRYADMLAWANNPDKVRFVAKARGYRSGWAWHRIQEMRAGAVGCRMSAHNAEEMIDLGRKLWGDQNASLSTREDIRFGSKGSKSIRRSTGEWFDHEDGRRGRIRITLRKGSWRSAPERHWKYRRDLRLPRREWGASFPGSPQDAEGFQPARARTGNGGWIWNLQGTARVLYKLPELLSASPGATVFIPEGEKDVDALREHLLVATCNPGGARKWATNSTSICAVETW